MCFTGARHVSGPLPKRAGRGNASPAPTHSRSMSTPFEKRAHSEVGQGQKQEKNKQLSDPGAEGV